MCNSSNDNSASSAIVPYSLKSLQAAVAAAAAATAGSQDPTSTAAAAYVAASIHQNPAAHLTQAALDHYRMQLYSYVSYADRLRYAHHHHHQHQVNPSLALATSASHHHPYAGPPHTLVPLPTSVAHVPADVYALTSPYTKFDPCRAYRLHQEEPKPQHSYIGLIGMAILSSADKKLVLSDIYQYILDNYSYFRNRGPGWRNSIRHNLSLNDCFIKAGRSANGKGHFWAIHPANLEDFKKGDFRRRKAQRRVRKHLGLLVPEDEDSLSPPPQPPPTATVSSPTTTVHNNDTHQQQQQFHQSWAEKPDSTTSGNYIKSPPSTPVTKKRRQFDMDSILAPERRHCCECNVEHSSANIVCCNDFNFNSRGIFGSIYKNNASHIKKPTSAWTESKQEVEHQSSSEDNDGKSEQLLMMDECSSSSLITETNPNWSIPAEEEHEDEIVSNSRPNSSSSSCSNASSSSYGGAKATTASNEKGLSLFKGPNDVSVMEQFRQTKFLPVSSTIQPSNVSSTNVNMTKRSNEPLLTITNGPLALIPTPIGMPTTHSKIESENKT